MRAVTRFTSSALILATVSMLLAPRLARAEWPELGRALCLNPADQERPKAATDGAAGAIVVWQDARSARVNIFARRVLASGDVDPRWPIDGQALLADSTALATASAGQQFPVIASDGTGGAIVAWQDGRRSQEALEIFAQHVLGSGIVDPGWPANGVAVCRASGQRGFPRIVPDGAGGAIIAWVDFRNSANGLDIFAQHVLPSGVVDPGWPVDGVALSTAPADQAFHDITTDGSGGAIVTWSDFRPSATGVDIYAQHVASTGLVDPAWPVNGRALSVAPGDQYGPTIVSDDAQGAILTWEDTREGPALSHIFALRVTATGLNAPGWPANGLAVCTAPMGQDQPRITSDGSHGAIVTWRDLRSGTNHNPFAQHVLASGVVDPAWPVDGRALSLSSGEEFANSIVEDGAGGAIISWEEDSFIFANHVEASGALDPTFPVNGRFVRLLLTFQRDPDLTAAGTGSAIVAWADGATGLSHDIYAMLVTTAITSGVPDPVTPGIVFAPPSPNPARGQLTLRFALPRDARLTLAIYDVSGRRVRELASGALPAGEHSLAWDLRDDSGRAVSPGLYFARFETEGSTFTQKLTALR